jgi:hypothetical protein
VFGCWMRSFLSYKAHSPRRCGGQKCSTSVQLTDRKRGFVYKEPVVHRLVHRDGGWKLCGALSVTASGV